MKKTLAFFFISLATSYTLQLAAQHSDSIHIHNSKHIHRGDSAKHSQFSRRAQDVLTTVFRQDEPVLNNADSIIKVFDNLPSFGIYKNNYIVTGTALNEEPTRYNSDAKFQISVSQRLTNSVLPFRTYLILTYTQLAYWNVYQKSFPFGDINYNPTIGVGKALTYKNRFLGTVSMQFEHESNGRDEDESRSWNKISFSGIFKINRFWTVQSKMWIPIVDGENNPNIVRYKGWGHIASDYNYKNKYNFGLLITKRGGGFFDANITANYSLRLFKNENQYLFLEYYNGYGENLLDYKRYRHMLRIGFVISPSFFHIY
ncbi:phospholipase [Dysgonomonas sp. 216]|uniref:phospholipase A n=1 Tax=Dysgonomonas sp. 216 TaxID=2302934 RepID=UPI0013D5D832|nr:phospholipase A [Dysgonomonas sp. 216]NDW19511.1 phospholipase [Dysgonomonas sp. 216]